MKSSVVADVKKRNEQAESMILNLAGVSSENRNGLLLSRSNSSFAKSADRGLHF